MDITFDQRDFDIVFKEDTEGMVDLDFIESTQDKLMQRLYLRFKTYPRDLFWKHSYGIDYLNTVFGIKKSKNNIDIIIQNEIIKEPLVKEITYFESEIENYAYACKFSVLPVNETISVTYYILTTENGAILTNELGDTLTARI